MSTKYRCKGKTQILQRKILRLCKADTGLTSGCAGLWISSSHLWSVLQHYLPPLLAGDTAATVIEEYIYESNS